ncbi:hypothetical protein ACFPM0_04855 [Pseudonocardia sulfidoxydans]|uniref:hypothetical protein n=1 Tax=Pseudonocardia sulfidoxydans TaxID=54011 RepID=UPI003619DDF1
MHEPPPTQTPLAAANLTLVRSPRPEPPAGALPRDPAATATAPAGDQRGDPHPRPVVRAAHLAYAPHLLQGVRRVRKLCGGRAARRLPPARPPASPSPTPAPTHRRPHALPPHAPPAVRTPSARTAGRTHSLRTHAHRTHARHARPPRTPPRRPATHATTPPRVRTEGALARHDPTHAPVDDPTPCPSTCRHAAGRPAPVARARTPPAGGALDT